MSTTTALLAGLAQMMASAGLGNFDPVGPLPAGQWGITVVSLPQSPDLVQVLTPYNVADVFDQDDSTVGVQVRVRGDRDPRTYFDRDDALFDLFHGLRAVTVGGVPVVSMARQSGTYLGPDANGRHEGTSNYYVQVVWPAPLRVD